MKVFNEEDKKVDIGKLISDLGNAFDQDEKGDFKAVQIIKGLAFSDDPKAKEFMKELRKSVLEIDNKLSKVKEGKEDMEDDKKKEVEEEEEEKKEVEEEEEKEKKEKKKCKKESAKKKNEEEDIDEEDEIEEEEEEEEIVEKKKSKKESLTVTIDKDVIINKEILLEAGDVIEIINGRK